MRLSKDEMLKLFQVSKLDKKMKKEWLNHHRLYNKNQTLSDELREHIKEMKIKIKGKVEENIDIMIHDIYFYNKNLYYIYLFYPIGWSGKYRMGLGWNKSGNKVYNPNDFKLLLSINGELPENLKSGLSTYIDIIEDFIYALSNEAEQSLASIKEKEDRKKVIDRKKKYIWKLEQIITQLKIKSTPSSELGIVYYLEEDFGFITNLRGEEFYFKVIVTEDVNKMVQKYSLVEFIPMKKYNKLQAANLKIILENVYELDAEFHPNKYRRFGLGKRKSRKGYGGTPDKPWKAF